MVEEKINVDKELLANAEFYSAAKDFNSGNVVNETYVKKFITEESDGAILKKTFKNRLSRTYNINVTAPIIAQHRSSLAQELEISEIEPAIIDDVTGYGTSAKDAFSWLLEQYLLCGRGGVLVEAPSEVGKTRLEEKTIQFRPYQVLYEADQIIVAKVFKDSLRRGQFSDVVLFNGISKNGDEKLEHYRRYYFPENSATYSIQELSCKTSAGMRIKESKSLKVEDETVTDREVIPFTTFGEGRHNSVVRDVVPLNHALLNRLSIVSNINYYQGFQQSVVFTSKDMKTFQETAENKVIIVPDTAAKLELIPAGSPASVYEEIQMIIHWAKRIGMMQFAQMLDESSAQVQSVQSRSKDLIALEHFYNDTADMFETKLKQVYCNMMSFIDAALTPEALKDKVKVSISRNFNLSDTELELQQDALAWQWAAEAGDVGGKIRSAILSKYVLTLNLETEAKNEIVKQLKEPLASGGRTDFKGIPNLSNLPNFLDGAPETNNEAA